MGARGGIGNEPLRLWKYHLRVVTPPSVALTILEQKDVDKKNAYLILPWQHWGLCVSNNYAISNHYAVKTLPASRPTPPALFAYFLFLSQVLALVPVRLVTPGLLPGRLSFCIFLSLLPFGVGVKEVPKLAQLLSLLWVDPASQEKTRTEGRDSGSLSSIHGWVAEGCVPGRRSGPPPAGLHSQLQAPLLIQSEHPQSPCHHPEGDTQEDGRGLQRHRCFRGTGF